MSQQSVVLYCSDEFAFRFVSVLRGCGEQVEVVTQPSEQDRGRHLYPVAKVLSKNVTVLVRGFPPQPAGERNRGNGRNALVLQYIRRDERKHPEELQRLLESVRMTLVNNGAETE